MASSTAWLLSRDHRTVNILLPDLWCHNDEFHFISLCFNTFAPWCLFKSHCSIESIWGASAYKMSLLKMSIKRVSPMVPQSWQLFLLISSSLRLANLSYFFSLHSWVRWKMKGDSVLLPGRKRGSGAEPWSSVRGHLIGWWGYEKVPGKKWGELRVTLHCTPLAKRYGV